MENIRPSVSHGLQVNCHSELEKLIHADSELPPLLRIGMIHYQFEAIHLFLDGNGRVGRLMVAFLFVAWGLLSQPLLYLSIFIETNRQEYYNRLLAVSQKGAWEAWLVYFLDGVHSQAEDAGMWSARLESLRSQYRGRFAGLRSLRALEALLDYLIGSPIPSITHAQETLQIGSYQMIQRNIEKLRELGIVRGDRK